MDAHKKYKQQQEQIQEQESNKRKTQSDYGAFIFLVFDYRTELFPDIKSGSLTRLLYLSTYLNYKGYLSFDNGAIITKHHMQGLLKLQKRAFTDFYNEMIINQFFIEKENLVYLNSDMFKRGRGAIQDITSNFTRICVDGVRNLYENSNLISSKQIGYIFRVLPWTNRMHNIVCYNPDETDINQIRPMSLGDFCDIIHYNKSKATRLRHNLFDCGFGSDIVVAKYQSDQSNALNFPRILINPKLFYGGNEFKKVEELGEF